MIPEEVLSALMADERAAIEAAQDAGNNAAIKTSIDAALARLGVTDRSLVGRLMERLHVARPKTLDRLPAADLVLHLPYPLGWKLHTLLREAKHFDKGESAPQLAFDVFALVSALLRMAAVVAVHSYVARGATDSKTNRTIVETLGQALVDEKWRDLARAVARQLVAQEDVTDLDKQLARALDGEKVDPARRAPRIGGRDVKDIEYLIDLRNHVAHGERVDAEHIRSAVYVVTDVLARFSVLARYRLVVRTGRGGFELEGEVPRPVDALDLALPQGEPCLIPREGEGSPLSLSPLLRFRAGTTDLAMDELFFLNVGTLERLSYVGLKLPYQLDGKALGSYESFRQLMRCIPTPPIPEDPRLDFSALASENTRFFVGRESVLGAIEAAVRDRPAPYAVVRALPGMGKTSLLARLHQMHPPRRPGETGAGDRWCFHFCGSTDGRSSPVVMMRSLMAQACDAVGFDEARRHDYIKSTDIKNLRDDLFPALLAEVAKRLEPGERLVLAIDALDEGFAGEDPIASALPGGLPENAIAILSWRVDESGGNGRVEEVLGRVPEEARHAIVGADPLRGLTRQNVSDFVAQVRRALAGAEADAPLPDFAPPEAVLDAVWIASQVEGGADPFYLRFLAQNAEAAAIDLDRAESIPESLDDAFEDAWLGLPTDHDFALHRLLLHLAILQEPGTDALLAELLTRECPIEPMVPNDVAALRIDAGKLLAYDGDRYSLFHDRFRRFLVGEQKDPLDVAPAEG